MRIDRTSRLVFAITSAVAGSLIFCLTIAAASAAPAEPSPPPVTPTPEAKPSPVVVLSPPAATPSKAVENSVVKIFATLRQPDPTKPWAKKEPSDITASGAVISGKRILTNAHVVQYASEVQVQANQAGDKLPAIVKAVAPGMDLAILELEDEKFFDSHSPLPFKKSLPDSKEPVMVYGYPTGGASLSITKGIISRIEFTGYSLSTLGLRIQIDAAINPGNSGGPAIVNDEIVGVAFSHLQMAQNIGYIIPVEEIELFLQDIADGHYDGPELKGSYPSYFVYGPIVFSEATTDLIALAQRNRETSAIVGMLTYIGSPLITRIGDKPAFPGERLVVVPCPFFPHRLSKGYGNPGWQVLRTVNHQPIKNLAHLVEVMRDLKDEFVTFEFNTRSSGEAIVFPTAEMVSATENILNDNGVRSQGSTDVMKIWTAKTTDH